MKRFLILLSIPFCLFSSVPELYIQPGVSLESYDWHLKDDFLFNSFNKLKWDNTVALMTGGIILRGDPQGPLADFYLQVEGETILGNRTTGFKAVLPENNPPVYFSNVHSPHGKLTGSGFRTELGWSSSLTPNLILTSTFGYFLQNRHFSCEPGAFDDPVEVDVASFMVGNFHDKKNFGGVWTGIGTCYFPTPYICLTAEANYAVGLLTGNTKWDSEEIFNDGFSFLCIGKITNLRRKWRGAKVKLGIDYQGGTNWSIGLRGFYDFISKQSTPDTLSVYQNTLTPDGRSIGQVIMTENINSKIQWQAFTLSAQFTYLF